MTKHAVRISLILAAVALCAVISLSLLPHPKAEPVISAMGVAIESVTTSTGADFIEPALGDWADIKWRGESTDRGERWIAVLEEDPRGPVQAPNGGERYTIVAKLPLDAGPNGTVSWPAKGKQSRVARAGPHRLAILDNGGRIGFTDHRVNVAPTASDAYYDEFYPDTENQGKTSIHYTLSSAVKSCTASVAGMSFRGTTKGGENTLKNVWDGTQSKGGKIHIGFFPVTVTTDPPTGPSLRISDVELWKISGESITKCPDGKFRPDKGEKIEIRFRVCEPVKRPHSTRASIEAVVHDGMSGMTLKELANDLDGDVDNDPADGVRKGQNRLVWDGKSDGGGIGADEGVCRVCIWATSNAGMGCQSPMEAVTLRPESSHEIPEEIEFGEFSDPPRVVVSAVGAEPGTVVQWTYTLSGRQVSEGKGRVSEEGTLAIPMKADPGRHVIVATYPRQGKPDVRGVYESMVNDFVSQCGDTSSGRPLPDRVYVQNRFRPDEGQVLKIQFLSRAEDHAEYDVRPLSRPLIWPDPSKPVSLREFVAGLPELWVRKDWSDHKVKPGVNTLTWDGRDDSGKPVPSGLYEIHVINKPPMTTEFGTISVVDRSSSGPRVTDIRTRVEAEDVVFSWRTSVPAGCGLDFGSGMPDRLEGRSIVPSTAHRVSLPRMMFQGRERFWVVAQDLQGRSSMSPMQTFDAGDTTRLRKAAEATEPVSHEEFHRHPVRLTGDTAAEAKWRTDTLAYGRVRYAKVGKSLIGLEWQTVSQTSRSTKHLVTVKGLAPDSDYLFVFEDSADKSFAKPRTSRYYAICTKERKPKVEIISPGSYENVSGVIDVVVRASDPIRRFTDNGLTRVEIRQTSGDNLKRCKHVPGTDIYTFRIDTAAEGPGSLMLEAEVEDEFGLASSYTRTVWVKKESKPKR